MLVKIIIRVEEKRFSHFHTQQFHFHTFIARQGGRGSRASESNWRPACLQIPVPGDVLPLGPEGGHNDVCGDSDYDVVYVKGGEEDKTKMIKPIIHHLFSLLQGGDGSEHTVAHHAFPAELQVPQLCKAVISIVTTAVISIV